MKKLIGLLFLCGTAFAQVYTPTNPTSYGHNENRAKALIVQHIPAKDGLVVGTSDCSPQIFLNTLDNKVYVYSCVTGFITVGTGAGGGGGPTDTVKVGDGLYLVSKVVTGSRYDTLKSKVDSVVMNSLGDSLLVWYNTPKRRMAYRVASTPALTPQSVPFAGSTGILTEDPTGLYYDGTNLWAGHSAFSNSNGIQLNGSRGYVSASGFGVVLGMSGGYPVDPSKHMRFVNGSYEYGQFNTTGSGYSDWTHYLDLFTKLRIRGLSTDSASLTNTGTVHMVTVDKNGLFNHQAIPGGSGGTGGPYVPLNNWYYNPKMRGTFPVDGFDSTFRFLHAASGVGGDNEDFQLLYGGTFATMRVNNSIAGGTNFSSDVYVGRDQARLTWANASSQSKQIAMSNSMFSGIIVADQVDHMGLVGNEDFSPNYGSTSYVQKGYVDAAVAAGSGGTYKPNIAYKDSANVFIVPQTLQGGASSGGGSLSSEFLTTGSGTDWTGTNYSTGYTHTAGTALPLTSVYVPGTSSYYYITVTLTGTAGNVTPSFGGYTGAAINFGGTYTFGFRPSAATALVFTPSSTFDGTVTSSVKIVTAATNSVLAIKSSTGINLTAINAIAETNTTAIGRGTLLKNMSGITNTAVGTNSLTNNVSGSTNDALGYNALFFNSLGSSNAALSNSVLYQNTTGSNNVGAGSFALTENTTGGNNTAVGFRALASNTTGNGNVAVGINAGRYYVGTINLTSVSNGTYIGNSTQASGNSITNETVIGNGAVGLGSNTVAIGNSTVANFGSYGNHTLLGATNKFILQATMTAAGTVGAQTINRPTGSVNIVAGGTSVVVTNSTCGTNSIVYAVVMSNDATAVIKNIVPAAGSFTINLNAATTAETKIGFIVFN